MAIQIGFSSDGPKTVLLHDKANGFLFIEAPNSSKRQLTVINAGIPYAPLHNANHLCICPNGVIYISQITLASPAKTIKIILPGTW